MRLLVPLLAVCFGCSASTSGSLADDDLETAESTDVDAAYAKYEREFERCSQIEKQPDIAARGRCLHPAQEEFLATVGITMSSSYDWVDICDLGRWLRAPTVSVPDMDVEAEDCWLRESRAFAGFAYRNFRDVAATETAPKGPLGRKCGAIATDEVAGLGEMRKCLREGAEEIYEEALRQRFQKIGADDFALDQVSHVPRSLVTHINNLCVVKLPGARSQRCSQDWLAMAEPTILAALDPEFAPK